MSNVVSDSAANMEIVGVSALSLGLIAIGTARQNLAASFVNGFINACFGQDKLMSDDK